MTHHWQEQPNVWSLVREDRDIDDIIFAADNAHQQEHDLCSER